MPDRGRVGIVVAGVLVVALVAAGVLALVLRDDGDGDAGPPPAEAADALLEAWERSRTVEVVVRSDFTRTFPDGREVAYAQRLVQRPPDDRLVIGAGSASGRLDGRIIRCNVVDGGPPECVQGQEAVPYDEEVAAELADLASLVDPDTGAYEVRVDEEGCFGLTLVAEVFAPPYGNTARFCFDEASGATSEAVIERDEAVDRTEAVEIRTEVTAADLRADDIGEPIEG
jgi:hypothetical protein